MILFHHIPFQAVLCVFICNTLVLSATFFYRPPICRNQILPHFPSNPFYHCISDSFLLFRHFYHFVDVVRQAALTTFTCCRRQKLKQASLEGRRQGKADRERDKGEAITEVWQIGETGDANRTSGLSDENSRRGRGGRLVGRCGNEWEGDEWMDGWMQQRENGHIDCLWYIPSNSQIRDDYSQIAVENVPIRQN